MRVIEVLGSGCPKCQYVEKLVREVVDAAGIEVEVRHVTDYGEIAASSTTSRTIRSTCWHFWHPEPRTSMRRTAISFRR